MTPPLLPRETLHRVLRVARFDGRSVLMVAGTCALLSAVYGNVPSALVCLVISGAGAVELHGVSLIQRGEPGMDWLIWSQVLLFITITAYAAANFLHPSPEILGLVKAYTVVPPDLEDQLKANGMTIDEALLGMMRLVYFLLGALTFLYQGGMMVYYVRRRAAVDAALDEPDLF